MCFLVGGALHTPVAGPEFFVPDYVELFFGYGFGSLIFLVGAYLMILEIAQEDEFVPSSQAERARLRGLSSAESLGGDARRTPAMNH